MGKKARNKSRQMRKAQAAIAAQHGRRVNLLFLIGAALITALVAAIAVVAVTSGHSASKASAGPLIIPKNLVAEGTLLVGRPDAAVTVDIWLDFQCPACKAFEQANGADLNRLVAAGVAKEQLHPISFLDRMSNGNLYSTRAANAIAAVVDAAPDRVGAFTAALYDNQPAENSSGLTDAQLARLAVGAGVPQVVIDTFSKGTFRPWVAKVTQEAFDAGINSTPTVKLNGQLFTDRQAGDLAKAIDAAAR